VIGPYYRAGSWVTILEVGSRTKVGSIVVDIFATVEPLL
jgi:hypothetical protein